MGRSSVVARIREGVLVRPSMLEPATPGFRVVGCFNPAAFRAAGRTWLIVRVAEAAERSRRGFFPSPRADFSGRRPRVVVDQVPHRPKRGEDTRGLLLPDGTIRLRFISHLRLARVSDDGLQLEVLDQRPWLFPEHPWEEFGVEDPRATIVGRELLITYVAVGRQLGIAPALLRVKSLDAPPERLGTMLPSENKDVMLFPRKLKRKYVTVHRPMGKDAFTAPNIQIASSPDLVHWGEHRFVMGPSRGAWDSYRIGGGPPPVRVKRGWLLIYHGVERRRGAPIGRYSVGAALLDAKDPSRVIARSPRPILRPTRLWEREGFTPNVIFPTGVVLRGDELTLFCGAADECVTSVTVSLREVLSRLEKAKWPRTSMADG
ncbi:MAG: glycoside hydrolase family 130 protein [Planctomycetota bacterium]